MFSNILGGAAGFPVADLGDTVSQSLRFRGSQLLTTTRSSAPTAASTNEYCFSMWVKFAGTNASAHAVIAAGSRTSAQLQTNTAGDNQMQWIPSSHSGGSTLTTTAQFRDYGGWYHLHGKYDPGDTSTSGIYINSVLVSTTPSNVSTNGSSNSWLADNSILTIGFIQATINQSFAEKPYEGYIAEVHFIDGQALDPTSFARYNEDGVWVPRTYTGTYGNNGFHLDFADSSDLGNDVSGNNNDFTATGFETTAISSSNFDNDVDYKDTPTSNYPTFNPLATAITSVGGTQAIRASETHEGNLHIDSSGQVWGTSNVAVESGKWYFEVESNMGDGYIGIHNNPFNSVSNLYYQTEKLYAYTNSGTGRTVGPVFATNITTGLTQYVSGDIIGVAVDIDAGEIYFSVNGTWENSADPAAGTNPPIDVTLTGDSWTFGGGSDQTINFGQRDFIYTPPTGFKALHANNLNEPTIKNGRDHFNILTWTGTGSSNALTGLGFQPDLVWVKKRGDTTESHDLQDSIRGAGQRLRTNSPDISRSINGTITSFDSDGFTVVDSGTTNESGKTYVAWCWKAGETFTPSQTGGLTNLSGTRNTEAGFSIISYRGAGANATVGHGLNSSPEFIIFKDYTDANEENWVIWVNGFDVSTGEHLAFNTGAVDTLSTLLNGTAPTSSVIHLGNNVQINDSGEDVIAYCWHSVEGFSKIGSYTGNANANGPFIYTGFEVHWLLVKCSSSGGSAALGWQLIDTTRQSANPNGRPLHPNTTGTEDNFTSAVVDLLSNGFKIRGTADQYNKSGATYVYMALARNPFGGENAAPATAR